MDGTKVKRRDLKEDKVYMTMADVVDFIVRHQLQFVLGAFAVLVVFALAYFYNVSSARKASDASFALYKADQLEDPAEKVQALADIPKEFAGAPAAALAQYQQGNLLYEEKKYEEARRAFSDFLKRNPNHPAAPAAIEALGYCYESLGQWKEAQAEYEKLKIKYASLPAAKRIMYRLGLCYEHAGDTDKAVDAYKKTVELLPDSVWADYANERLSSLTGKLQVPQAAAVKG